MSQADMEKAYTEAVEQLARAVEANRLLTERLEAQELALAAVRRDCAEAMEGVDLEDDSGGSGSGEFDDGWQKGNAQMAVDILAQLDHQPAPSHPQEPPARPGVP